MTFNSLKTSANHILATLSCGDQDLLVPHLTVVDLPFRKSLEMRDRPIEHVYFIEHGYASTLATGQKSGEGSVGIIGREGMTGLAILMANDRSPYETYVQSAGNGYRIPASELQIAMEISATLRHALLRCGYSFVIQTSDTAIVNGNSKLLERLARWLLMAHDRADGDELCLTHEYLALALSVRRPGVTQKISQLEKDGIISTRRGCIAIVDRNALTGLANGSYRALKY